MLRQIFSALTALLLAVPSLGSATDALSPKAALKAARTVTDGRLRRAGEDAKDWITHGRTYSEQRFSPLSQINAHNVASLDEVWSFDTGTRRGLEATPIVIDGVMFVTGSWSVVYALDARTGKLLWKHDPQVPRETGQKACCDVVNRGVAVHEGKVFVGTLDGRLVALDAGSGEVVWEKMTVDPSKPYTITAAPRVVKGKVLIGNGGAEFGVRGYLGAYDADDGELAWRFYTIPGNPEDPVESEALEKALPTWTGEWWKYGGGGTVWDSLAYDPELDLLYVGVGNGSPWVRDIRSPDGGDNLYLSSILALDPDDGKLVWHYQTTPGDTWDFTATQHMILADLEIDGEKRKVLMQAPKNGFFYVLDRETGELISAEKYVEVTWAERVDPKTGRPVEVEGARFEEGMALVKPTPFGGHNWQPMAFHPGTGLVYIPAQEITGAYERNLDFEFHPGRWNTGTKGILFSGFRREHTSGHLLAWDPVAQKEAWRQPMTVGWNGGVLATGGGLVFQGNAQAKFVAYQADDGTKLWEGPTGSGVIAAPVTWELDGRQYVTVLAGWGGAYGLLGGQAVEGVAGATPGGNVLTYALPESKPSVAADGDAPDPTFEKGLTIYHDWCARCHGADAIAGGTSIPDLRRSNLLEKDAFVAFVLEGIPGTGMPGFADLMSKDDAKAIQDYVKAVR